MADAVEPTLGPGPAFPTDASDSERARWMNILANIPLLERVNAETWSVLSSHVTFERYAPEALIFDEHEPARFVFFILDGVARVFQGHSTGIEYTPKLFRAPTHFGDLAALSGLGQYRSSVAALGACVVARVPIKVAEERIAVDHALAVSWLYSVARQHSCTIDLDRQNVFGTLTTRLANALLSYDELFGVPAGAMRLIAYPLSYTKLAHQVGCHRRNAISAIKRMAERKLVRTTSDGLLIDTRALLGELLPERLSLTHSLRDVKSGSG